MSRQPRYAAEAAPDGAKLTTIHERSAKSVLAISSAFISGRRSIMNQLTPMTAWLPMAQPGAHSPHSSLAQAVAARAAQPPALEKSEQINPISSGRKHSEFAGCFKPLLTLHRNCEGGAVFPQSN
jgi:hypothetical protein